MARKLTTRPDRGHEYKFSYGGLPEEKEAARARVIEALKAAGYSVGRPVSAAFTDHYLDDTTGSLRAADVSLRVRKKHNVTQVIIKRREPAPFTRRAGKAARPYRRVREVAVVSPEVAKSLLSGNPVLAWPYRLVSFIKPDCGPLQPVLTTQGRRERFVIMDASGVKMNLCLDDYSITEQPPTNGQPHFDLELEARGEADDALALAAAIVARQAGWEPTDKSKFERYNT